MRYTSMTTFNKEPIARPTTFAESFNMKYLTLSLIAIILVSSLKHQPIHNESQSNPDNKIAIIAPLEAKVFAEAQTLAPVVTEPTPVPTPPVVAQNTSAGNCEQWFIEAGIDDLANARELVRRENAACNPQRWNMAGSSACGVAQELPCGKSGCGVPPNADGLCQVKWQKNYVLQRYGSYAAAIAFHDAHHWY